MAFFIGFPTPLPASQEYIPEYSDLSDTITSDLLEKRTTESGISTAESPVNKCKKWNQILNVNKNSNNSYVIKNKFI